MAPNNLPRRRLRTPPPPLIPPSAFDAAHFGHAVGRDRWAQVTLSREELWGEARGASLWLDGQRRWARVLHQAPRVMKDMGELTSLHEHLKDSLLRSWAVPSYGRDRGPREVHLHRLWVAPPPAMVPPGWLTFRHPQEWNSHREARHWETWASWLRWAAEPEIALWATVSIPTNQNTWASEVLSVCLSQMAIEDRHRILRIERWQDLYRAAGCAQGLAMSCRWHDMIIQGNSQNTFFTSSEASKIARAKIREKGLPPSLASEGPRDVRIWDPATSGFLAHLYGEEARELWSPLLPSLQGLSDADLLLMTFGNIQLLSDGHVFSHLEEALSAAWQDWARAPHPSEGPLHDAGSGELKRSRGKL